MTNPGYSGKSLAQKLGIKTDTRLLLLNAPAEYEKWVELPLKDHLVKAGEIPQMVHLFAASQQDFISGLKKILPLCKKNPALVIWVSWYKKAAGIATNLSEDIIRKTALEKDLVDVKVCAVSDTWSGLKLVVPLAKR